MRAYIELTKTDLLLALRDKSVLFFSYVFPLIFFFAFAELFAKREGGDIEQVVAMVLLMGILGNGLFGAGMRTVRDRESHVLRLFKVAPITPSPILVASLVTGWILYIPAVASVVGLAWFGYGLGLPGSFASFVIVVSLGVLSFRALGLILASIANSMQEVNILVQLFYTPMLFLSGALFPIKVLPAWLQVVSTFLPATYLVEGLQGIFLEGRTVDEMWLPVVALFVTILFCLFISGKLFRWEKGEKVPMSAKIWLLAALLPFIILGAIELAF